MSRSCRCPLSSPFARAMFVSVILLFQQDASGRAQQPASPAATDGDRKLDSAANLERQGRELQGRIDVVDGLRIVRVWGDADARGYAHGRLLAAEIMQLVGAEYAARFARQPILLREARRLLPRLIEYPVAVRAELEALWRGIVDSGVDLGLPESFGRDADFDDLLFVNALDVFGTMGCSGFTVAGDMVEGGGVLTTRNFDWPLTGPHLLESMILLVQQPDEGDAFASVTWPGYVGCVTGVDSEGVAAFLHVGSGERGAPEPDSMPTAIASREILQRARIGDLVAIATEVLELTSPPASYISRFVLPRMPSDSDGGPAVVFEVESDSVARRASGMPCVVTNHFAAHAGGTGDSHTRDRSIVASVQTCLTTDDRRVGVAEAWQAMAGVDRARPSFATLHTLVFRADPWVFELARATIDGDRVIAAPESAIRHRLTREQVFGVGERPGASDGSEREAELGQRADEVPAREPRRADR